MFVWFIIQILTTNNVHVYFSVVASLGLLAGSVIAALQVTIASLTVYHVTVKKMASQPRSATQTQGGVFAK